MMLHTLSVLIAALVMMANKTVVTGLTIAKIQEDGFIPTQVGEMTDWTVLPLNGNELTGPTPTLRYEVLREEALYHCAQQKSGC